MPSALLPAEYLKIEMKASVSSPFLSHEMGPEMPS